ncbi:MAG: AGE family epimerase/isomerase [Bacteroidales bacterium]|nr:AGE family epimerase/isomerase [Bacteroidales bacterium]
MTKQEFSAMAARYRNELYSGVLPFWLDNSQDLKYGGYFTCLDRDGSVFDTDKFVWLQGREVWMFAMLYNKVEKNHRWLECALQGGEFLLKHGHNGNFDFYFSLNREGAPLVQPYNIFSNTFACMAFAQLSVATGDQRWADAARKTFQRILERRSNPKGIWSKGYPGTRPMKDFALPMIICNMALEIEPIIDDKTLLDKTIEEALHEVFDVFYQPSIGVMVENLAPDGTLLDCFEGRKVNPGHDLEALWFMMNLGLRLKRPEIIEKSMSIALGVIEYGWDKEYGGIFYFMDRLGHPTQELEWDQKLWWVHLEAAICMIKGYKLTGNQLALDWFLRLDDYLWTYFKDPDYPEWFGYLNRRGEVLLPLKGGKWKGCFHVPRGLYQIGNTLQEIADSL